ncbi:MAG TPA: CBS domain-containing protein [Anaerolineaceae bacterium]|jgi:CBS domain-containing protein|nr:CBS domain-containing protein [Anaerolineaceae bacterium]
MKKVGDLMTRNVEAITQDASVKEAAHMMKDINVGVLPVLEGKRVVGMITDRDIVVRAVAEGKDPDKVKAHEIMTKNYIFVYEDQDVREAARLMSDRQIRRLLVLNHDNNLVGIVSLGDLSVDAGEDKLMAKTLEDISRPAKPDR